MATNCEAQGLLKVHCLHSTSHSGLNLSTM